MALGSLAAMHRRFARAPKVAQEYKDFMSQYKQLGHMTRIPASKIQH